MEDDRFVSDSVDIPFKNYLALVVVCLLAAIAAMLLWFFNRDVSWIGMAIPLFVYFDLALLGLTSLGLWANGAEEADARETCDPILRRYKRTGDVDNLLYGYELWRMESHGMATRITFIRTVINLLIEDGYVYEAADLLNDYQMMATTPDSIRSYQRFRKISERRMNAIVEEAAEQERRWQAERRAEERRRERRRREALEGQEHERR